MGTPPFAMSFQDFLKIAQQNQTINDDIVKKLSEEQKRKKDLFLKERKAIEAANKPKKCIESYIPSYLTSSDNEYDPSAALEKLNKKPAASVAAKQRPEAEYVPTPIPKAKKLSSLMDVLEEINGEIPAAEKRFKIKARIPKIGGSIHKSSKPQRIPGNEYSNGLALPPSKVKANNTVSSPSKSPNGTKILTNATLKLLPKPGIASQRDPPFNKLSASLHKHVHKPTLTFKSSGTSHNQSSVQVSAKTIIHKTHSNPPFRSEKRALSSLKPALSKPKTINSIRHPSSLGPASSNHPPRGIAAQYGLIPTSIYDLSRQSEAPLPKMQISKPLSSMAVLQPTPSSRLPNRSSGNPINTTKRLLQTTKNRIPIKRTVTDPSRSIQPPLSTIPSTQSPNQPIVRGIAAQLGVFPPRGHDYADDSDDYESDDSFIDDSDCTSAKEYKIARNEIYKTLHFDPKKYAKVSKYDDLSTMESSYQRIEREEKLR